MVPPAIGALTQCYVRGGREQARFPDMNREGTAFGVDGLFRLIGTGEDYDRRSQVRNEHPGDANHKSASGVMFIQETDTREV
jgi:hypothetical protein